MKVAESCERSITLRDGRVVEDRRRTDNDLIAVR
jgi:hypothetical protein